MHYTRLWERAVPQLCFTVYFYNRRLLDRLWYYRYVVPKAYVYFIKLTMAAQHVQAATHVKAELTQTSRRGLRISKVNYQESWGHETHNGQAANCLWSLNGLFIKGFSSICIFSPFLKSVLSLKRVWRNVRCTVIIADLKLHSVSFPDPYLLKKEKNILKR